MYPVMLFTWISFVVESSVKWVIISYPLTVQIISVVILRCPLLGSFVQDFMASYANLLNNNSSAEEVLGLVARMNIEQKIRIQNQIVTFVIKPLFPVRIFNVLSAVVFSHGCLHIGVERIYPSNKKLTLARAILVDNLHIAEI